MGRSAHKRRVRTSKGGPGLWKKKNAIIARGFGTHESPVEICRQGKAQCNGRHFGRGKKEKKKKVGLLSKNAFELDRGDERRVQMGG